MKIGQIVWVIDASTNSVVPVLISEKITKETLQGEHVEYVVDSPPGMKGPQRLGPDTKHKYFETVQHARQYLTDSAARLIDTVMAKAENAAKVFAIPQQDVPAPVQVSPDYDTIVTDVDMIRLPDGRLAKARIKTA